VPDVLILGCGFTGRRVAERLRARGIAVHGTHRDTLNLEHPDALADLRALLAPGMRVLHSVPTLPGEQDRLAVAALAGAARVVYFSTTGVYGQTECVDETTPAAPVTDRAKARVRTERAVLNGPWSSLVLRPAAIYGPGRVVRYARSPACVSRIHVDDLAAHAEASLFSEVTGAWPVADEHPCPSAEVAEFARRVQESAPGPPTRPAPASRRVDGSAIRRKLGIALLHPSYKTGVAYRIFLAEDNPADVYLVREAFRQHGLVCDLRVASDGEEAIRYIREIGRNPASPIPDLTIMDLNLPRVDRGEILREFNENPACHRLPLIVLSSSDAERDLRAAGQLRDGSLFFRKPAELDAFLELGAKARQMLENPMD
jgi:CheY-like chemotaxis protein